MTPETILIVLALVISFYMAWNIGANDVANAMGTSVGSGALTLKWAIVVAAMSRTLLEKGLLILLSLSVIHTAISMA